VARGGFHGLFIEMKAPSTIGPDGRKRAGRETAEQKAWGERLRAEGYRVVVCWGFEEARAEIMQYLDVK
jgi:hypothetical protein